MGEHGPDRRRLIVTADDAGLHESINAAIVRTHREGIVTACSVVANGAAFADAVERLKTVPSLSVGVHLTFVEEKPLLPLDAVRSLTNRAGSFVTDYRRFVARALGGRVNWLELERELRAQIERVAASGLPVEHLNGHQHLHLLPPVLTIVRRLAREYSIRYVRIVNDRGGSASLLRLPQIALLNTLGRIARRRLRGDAVSNDSTIGVRAAGHLTTEVITALLPQVRGVTELVCHPGADDDALERAYGWRYGWAREAEALTDPKLRAAIESLRLDLITPRDIAR